MGSVIPSKKKIIALGMLGVCTRGSYYRFELGTVGGDGLRGIIGSAA